MAQAIRMGEFESRPELGALVVAPAHQAFRILQLGYFLLPLAVGADKFFNRLAPWSEYLAPALTRPVPAEHVAKIVTGIGVVEIFLALMIAFKPSVGAYLLALWLIAIIANLWLGGFYATALCDGALMLGAVALGRLAQAYQHQRVYADD